MSVDYGIRVSARARRVRLTLDRLGRPLVVLPVGTPERVAAEMVSRHGGWIERHQRRIEQEVLALAARPRLTEGGSLSVLGVERRVLVRAAPGRRRPRVSCADEPLPTLVVELPEGHDQATAQAAGRALEHWLRRRARVELERSVARHAAAMGLAAPPLSVRDQRTRWGSASASGRLSFSWRLVLCPPEVRDYVVVHELAHLRWRGHGPRFWALVRRHAPNADEHRRWLRRSQRALHAALDQPS